MVRPKKEGRFLNTKIKEESMKQLDDFCKKTGLSKTSAVENALDYYFEHVRSLDDFIKTKTQK